MRMLMNIHLSSYGQASAQPSPVSRMMEDFADGFRDGVDINLGVGYVNEKTIPVAEFLEAIQVVARDPVKYRRRRSITAAPQKCRPTWLNLCAASSPARPGGLDEATMARQRLIIGPCGATSVLDQLAEVMAPGIVGRFRPGLLHIYSNALERKGFEMLAVPEDARKESTHRSAGNEAARAWARTPGASRSFTW